MNSKSNKLYFYYYVMNFKQTISLSIILWLMTPMITSAEVWGTITRSVKPISTTQNVMENVMKTGFISEVDKEEKRLVMTSENGWLFYIYLNEDTKFEDKVKAGDFIDIEVPPIAIMIYPPQYTAISIKKSDNEFAKVEKKDGKYVPVAMYGMSENDYSYYKLLEEKMGSSFVSKVDNFIYNLEMKYSKTHPKQLASVFEQLADFADEQIHTLTMKYPADKAMSKKDTKLYYALKYISFALEVKAYKLSK